MRWSRRSREPQQPTAPVATPAPVPQGREERIGHGLRWLAGWAWRWIGIAIGAWILGWLVGVLWVIVLPLFLALVLASVLQPLSAFLVRRTPLPHAAAAALVLLGALVVLAGIVAMIVNVVASEWDQIVLDATEGLQRLRDWAGERGWVTSDQVDDAIAEARTRLSDSAGTIAGGVLTGVNAVTSALITVVLALVLTFLFLKDGHRFRPWLRRTTGPRVGDHLDRVLGQVWGALGGFIRTQAIVSLVDAVLIGLALVLVGVPLALPLAVVTFIGGFVPIVGAFAAGALAVLVALVAVDWQGALIVLAAILVVQQLEGNVLQPWLQGRAMQLHAGVVLLSVTLGSTLFGVVGAFLAVPVAAMAAVVLRYLSGVAEPGGSWPEDRLGTSPPETSTGG